jgi:hypothetical protein
MTEITPEALEALSKKAEQTEDDIRYYSGGSKYNEPLERLKDALVNAYRTGQLILAQPSEDEVEAVAELQLAAFLAGRGSVVSMEHGTRTAKPAPTMDEFRQMARTALDAHRGKSARKFNLGDRVTKTKGSSWTGLVVGFYSTSLTPIGYAVESENEPGSVQIYPESALEACLKARENSDG